MCVLFEASLCEFGDMLCLHYPLYYRSRYETIEGSYRRLTYGAYSSITGFSTGSSVIVCVRILSLSLRHIKSSDLARCIASGP
jgi:hypothetical protein